jgi:hypothetical protein
MEDIGNVSKKETDAVFGSYYDKSKHLDLKADTPHKRGNIHDQFKDTQKELAGLTKDQRREKARQLVIYFFQSDDTVRHLNKDHNASPLFDKDDKPKNDEAKVLTKLSNEFTRTDAQVKKLNEIDRGWPATADPRTKEVSIQLFKGETADDDRAFLWDMFQTLIHEYMHTLVHKDYRKFADSFGQSSNENNTLIEGVDSLLSEIVWTNVEPRIQQLRPLIEGPAYAKLPPLKMIMPPAQRRYPSYAEALRLVQVVGVRNVYAAYFMGDVKKIGAP